MRALRTRRNRASRGRFLAEGMRVVEDLLASGIPIHWALTSSSLEDSDRGSAIAAELARRGLTRRVVPDRDFEQLSATESPQGIIAVAEVPNHTVEDLDVRAEPCVVLVLDAVQDPGNVGTLIRSAEAIGAAGVIALPGTADPWNPKAVRAAAGSSFRIPIVRSEWSAAFGELRGRGFRVVGADRTGGSVADIRAPRVALVVGNEGAGISPPVRSQVDDLVGIPLRGRAESLNVAAAAAILLYELTR